MCNINLNLANSCLYISRRGRRPRRLVKFYISHLSRRGGYYPPVVKPHRLLLCHSERVKRVEESLLLHKHKLFLRCAGVTFGAKSNQNVGDGVDRRQWRMKGDGGRENNEQTRGASARRSMRRLFFRAIYGCDSPTPHKRCTSVECYVCYKSGKIYKPHSLCSFAL